jgi:hypothetical protein
MFRAISPIIRSVESVLQHVVFCTQFFCVAVRLSRKVAAWSVCMVWQALPATPYTRTTKKTNKATLLHVVGFILIIGIMYKMDGETTLKIASSLYFISVTIIITVRRS